MCGTVPVSYTHLSGMVTFLFNQVILMYLTQDALVSYTIISYVNNIVVLSATGIAQGAQPLISYYYGQKSLDKCKSLFRYSLVAAGVVCTVSFAACFTLARGIVDIFIGPEPVSYTHLHMIPSPPYSFSLCSLRISSSWI